MDYYAGIGSREAPADVLVILEELGYQLGLAGLTVRSGGADGADTAFEQGAIRAGAPKDIYIPWNGFNGNKSTLFGVKPEALALAATLHPAWDQLGQGPRKMHARNCAQILGEDLATPAKFVICWTPDGCESEKTRNRKTGGTATGIVLAERKGIPVFNLKNQKSRIALNELLDSMKVPYRVPLELEDGPAQAALF